MDGLLSGLKTIVDSLGATVLLPIVIFVIAVVMGAKPGRAFRAGVTIGVAFIGINLVVGLMFTSLSDVAQAIVKNTGITRDVVDVGWPSAAAIAFGSSVGLWVIPIGIAVNVLLLMTRMTRTLNVDVWNFWHFAFIGSLVVAATDSLFYGLVAAALMAALALLFADWTAKAVQRFYGIPGVSVPHLASGQILPIAIAVNWVIDRIPGLNAINLDTDVIQKKLGVFGEPVILGLSIGLVLGAIGYYDAGDAATVVSKVLKTGMNLAAVMFLLPRMVKILMEGLIPVSEAARSFVQKRAGDREILVGLDSAILIGHPAAISSRSSCPATASSSSPISRSSPSWSPWPRRSLAATCCAWSSSAR
jgi:PTS system galactitol-specific IIC component